MIEWFKRLFHHHEWNIFRTGPVSMDGFAVGYYHDMQCKICGKIKRKELT